MQNARASRPYLSPALPRIIAHRGFAGDDGISENTIEAFAAAIALGATHLETDIQVTKDGVPVLFHDEDLVRVAGLALRINQITAEDLAQVPLSGGGSIPTLREALEALPTARFNLDLKVGEAIEPSVRVIRELEAEARVLLTSFSDARRSSALKLLSNTVASSAGSTRVISLWLAAKLRLGRLVTRLAAPIDALQIPTGKGPIRFDSPAFMSKMIASGLELHYWTINDEAEMLRLVALGAHGIVTDRTDIAVKTLRKVS